MQGPETQFRLGNHGVTQLDLVVEQIVQLVDGNNGRGRRQLAVGNEVLAVGRRIQAVRVLGNRNVTGYLGLTATVHYRHLGVAQGLVVAGFDGSFDALNIEHHYPVAVVTHGAGQVDCLL